MGGDIAEGSRRETAKAERRRRIIEAAATLVREKGLDDVSMQEIAKLAEVSPATLYNLFQTKAAIFRQLFDSDLVNYRHLVAKQPAKTALDRLFVALEIAGMLYRRDPKFYRAMARIGGDELLYGSIGEPRRVFWQDAVAEAIAEGSLRASANAELLGGILAQIIRGVFLDWASGLISPERLVRETSYGFALALMAFASKGTHSVLETKLLALQEDLSAGREGKRMKTVRG